MKSFDHSQAAKKLEKRRLRRAERRARKAAEEKAEEDQDIADDADAKLNASKIADENDQSGTSNPAKLPVDKASNMAPEFALNGEPIPYTEDESDDEQLLSERDRELLFEKQAALLAEAMDITENN